MIRMFKMFLPRIQTEFTKVTRIYDIFHDKVYLLYIYVTACLIANFKQLPCSNYLSVYIYRISAFDLCGPQPVKQSHTWPTCRKVWRPLVYSVDY
jgi:hypothetical protein